MSHRRVAALAVLTGLLCACGPPVLDSSSPQGLVLSLEKLRGSLDPEDLALFEDALAYFTDRADLTRDPEALGPVVQACKRLEGMTAKQIILEAWNTRVALLESRVSELEARREASETARQVLSGLEVVESRLFPAADGFLDQPLIEVEVENHTRHRIFVASFQASLRHPEEIEPWIVEMLDRAIGIGLAPGQRVSLRLETQASDWKRVTGTTSDDVFVCDVMRLVGRGKKIIADSDYGSIHEHQLGAFEDRLAELHAAQPFK